MANRKQFLGEAHFDPELKAMLEKLGDTPVSDEQLREQRISFAFGNAPESEFITKESVRKSSKSIRLSA